MSDELEETGDFLEEKLNQLKELLIKEPTLVQIQQEADKYASHAMLNDEQESEYVKFLMAEKIIELESSLRRAAARELT